MNTKTSLQILLAVLVFAFLISLINDATACSSFKLQKGEKLVYGHNLNQGDIGVPGLIFINKRGIFKTGRTWSELFTKDGENPSSYSWISRYGSVTFNNFGKDFPDGGMNETGLFIWEMSDDISYPVNDSLPKLNQMNWMQYILDNCSTLEEALQCAYGFEIDGWGWHYFVGDVNGNCAAVAFINGEVIINKDAEMPVPGLFNTPYDREMEILKYYKGFGGLYEPVLNDPEVPRFVKTAVMVRDYDPSDDVVEYGLQMLDNLMVNDIPEWSILCDVREMKIYFKTRINPEIKYLAMDEIDFSNNTPAMMLNMDIAKGGDVMEQFHPFTSEGMANFIDSYLLPLLPEEFFTSGGLTLEELTTNLSTHSNKASIDETQFFKGNWKNNEDEDEIGIILQLITHGDAVNAIMFLSGKKEDGYPIDHLYMSGNELTFTFKTEKGSVFEGKTLIDGDVMKMHLLATEDDHGVYVLNRQ